MAIFTPDLLRFFLFISILPSTISQTSKKATAPPPAGSDCNGIFLSYQYTSGSKLKPSIPKRQPYRFESTLTVQNNGADELKSWQVFVGFRHGEILVSASDAVLADGTSLPSSVENGTIFAGYPMTDLKTAIETAGDSTQTSVQVKMVGTQFGVPLKSIPFPSNISLVNDGFSCPRPAVEGSLMYVCCNVNKKFKSNITVEEKFITRRSGDLTIMYDVTRTYDSSYWAQVTMANHNPLGRLDNWKVSWDWMKDEFINAMKGAYPSVVDATECIYGTQGTYYANLDFSNVLNCERRPTIVDLPATKANDSTLGLIASCCRNGTILPQQMDPSKSVSAFQMEVYKMPPDLNRSALTPPQNWRISGSFNPTYRCGPPARVSPTQFPNSNGLSDSTAMASWQVVCNITRHPKGQYPKCCVSFSAYYNDSVVPCRTCACGCPGAYSCSATAPALLLPSEAALIPFENRSALTVAWAGIKHWPVPRPAPCGDNCGVSVNWHLTSDYSSGWSARITMFNWEDVGFPDWFLAVQMKKRSPGFQAAYSFNGTSLVVDGVNNTVFMQGLAGLNYLVAESQSSSPQTQPRVPGKQQSVLSFTKKTTPGINVPAGDGFPAKLFFNGEECSLPSIYPTSNSNRIISSSTSPSTLLMLLLILPCLLAPALTH